MMKNDEIELIAEDEEWKYVPIDGFDDVYQISNYGRVIGHCGLIKPHKGNKGYMQVVMSNKGKQKTMYIHRLVALAFVENKDPISFDIINHLDENKSNNYYLNLEWSNCQKNNTYGNRIRKMQATRKKNIGRKRPVFAFKIIDNTIVDFIIFESISEASKKLGLQKSCIANCCNGIQKTSGGYRFDFL